MPEKNNISQQKDSLEATGNPQNGLSWVDNTIPRSVRFDDTYYSKANGLEEVGHVFIKGNNLAERIAQAGRFTVGELGFGTGLNFLALWHFWRETAPQDSILHFVSFELYPLSKQDMLKALSRWPDLADDAQTLLKDWNSTGSAFNFTRENVSLTVHFGDANICLPQMDVTIDAWFLDGFSPAKNPELWNGPLLQIVFDKTTPGGTFATYSAAGWIRRNLEAAGFQVSRTKGHAGKREMSVGNKPFDA